MTLPRLFSLNRYWENHPPTHLLVAAFMGYTGNETTGAGKSDGEVDFEELSALFQAIGGTVG